MMTDDEQQRIDDAHDREADQREKLSIPPHRFTVTLGRPANAVGFGGWGPDYSLACESDAATALCHWWRDEEGDPTSYRQHEECSILDWFNNDTADFVENGYAGPEHDGLTSGLVDIVMWGEDGFEWSYAQHPSAAAAPAGFREGDGSEYLHQRHLGRETWVRERGVPLTLEARKTFWVLDSDNERID